MLRQNEAGWSNPKVLTIFALIFLCGIACGSAITNSFLHKTSSSRDQAARQLGLDRLQVQLQLTPDQQRVVTDVVDDYAKYYQNIEEQRLDVAEHGKRRIWDVLSPEQKKRFVQLFKAPPLGAGAETAN